MINRKNLLYQEEYPPAGGGGVLNENILQSKIEETRAKTTQ